MSLWRRSSDRRGVATLEFAFAAGPFLVATFFTIALSLHLFKQEALDTALHIAVRQIQTGNAQNVTNGSAFITNYLCPNLIGVLACGSVSVNIQKITFSSGQDYYNFTTGGGIPLRQRVRSIMTSYASSKFCNSSPSQFILVTAIYTTPSILGSLLPNVFSVSYNGGQVDALMSQVGSVTENSSVQPPSGNTPPAPSC